MHNLEAHVLDGDGDLVEPVAFEVLWIEGWGTEQEGEAAEEVHQYTEGTYMACGTGVRM